MSNRGLISLSTTGWPAPLIFIARGRQMKKLKMSILLWIQGWSGQLNSWAWTEWDQLNREDWVKGYNKWKKNE